MEMIQKRPIVAILGALVIGIALGIVYGWFIDPIEWVAGDSAFLADSACQWVADTQDPVEIWTLNEMAAVVNGVGCTEAVTGVEPGTAVDEGADSGQSPLLLLGFLLILIVLAIAVVLNRRNAAMEDGGAAVTPRYAEVPDTTPVVGGEDLETVPIARFRTTYSVGHDTYDDSFSIENANGDFLGECGVSIAESIGADSPKNVTAFEVWLFDKNDIRTITKVVMSDHAFFDDAIKAKLAPKGEPLLARENETIVLETATLIINAEITEMQYGTGVLPPQSFFERFTIELSAWAKEGDFEGPDIQGRVDELLNI